MLSEFFQLIFPHVCINCEKIIDNNNYLCKECQTLFKVYDGGYCQRCGYPYPKDVEKCGECIEKTKPIKVLSVYSYTEHVRKAIHKMKYGNGTYWCRFFAEVIVKHFYDIILRHNIIIPVPLHYYRLRQRGYNQVDLIASHISYKTGIPVRNILKRTKATYFQAQLTPSKKKENLKGAFKMKRKASLASSLNILLIDDIYTSGTTITECIKVLENNLSIYSITCIVIARGDIKG